MNNRAQTAMRINLDMLWSRYRQEFHFWRNTSRPCNCQCVQEYSRVPHELAKVISLCLSHLCRKINSVNKCLFTLPKREVYASLHFSVYDTLAGNLTWRSFSLREQTFLILFHTLSYPAISCLILSYLVILCHTFPALSLLSALSLPFRILQ